MKVSCLRDSRSPRRIFLRRPSPSRKTRLMNWACQQSQIYRLDAGDRDSTFRRSGMAGGTISSERSGLGGAFSLYHLPSTGFRKERLITLETWVAEIKQRSSLRKYLVLRTTDQSVLARLKPTGSTSTGRRGRPLRIPDDLRKLSIWPYAEGQGARPMAGRAWRQRRAEPFDWLRQASERWGKGGATKDGRGSRKRLGM